MEQTFDRLIYGKNNTTNIVSIEVHDTETVIFQEIENTIITSSIPNKRWLLSNKPLDKSWTKLKGDLFYCYGKQVSSKDEQSKYIAYARKRNIDLFQMFDDKESCLVNKGITYFKGMTHTQPSILSFDIESTGLYHNTDSKVLLISNTFRKGETVTRRLFAYDEFSSDAEMLKAWCEWIREINPSLIVGHNIYSYDLPYLNFIAEKNNVTLNLGRDGSEIKINKNPSQFRIDGSRSQEYHKIRIYGREILDTMFLSIKHDIAAKKYESYGLKSIIKVEGLEKTNRVMYDASQIRFKYKDPIEWKKIKEYCEHDADDSLALYDLMAPAFFYLTQSVPKSFQGIIESATGSQINSMMVRSYLQEGHSIPKASPVKAFEGAISLGNPGNYSNCLKWDVASLYPSIILECKVYDEEKDPNGNFLKIMETFTEERLKNKRLAKTSKYHDDLQSSQKIVANSGYGFLGASGLNFNSPEAADFITKTGREILQTAIKWATGDEYKK